MGIGLAVGSVAAGIGGSLLGKKSAGSEARAGNQEANYAANRQLINQITPTGSVRYGYYDNEGNFVPDTGSEWTTVAQVSESPEVEAARKRSEQITQMGQESLINTLQSGITTNLPNVRSADVIRGILPAALASDKDLPTFTNKEFTQRISPDQYGAEISRLEDATFEAVRNRLDPTFRERENRLTQRLSDMGIPMGSAAYEREIQKLRQSEDDALTQAGFQAVQAGRGEQDRLARLGFAESAQTAAERGQLASERQQIFGERRSVLDDALRKQLSLAGLEQQARQQQLLENVQGLSVYSPLASGQVFTPLNLTGASQQVFQPNATGGSYSANALGSLSSILGSAAGGMGGGGGTPVQGLPWLNQ